MKDKDLKFEEVKTPHTLGWGNILLGFGCGINQWNWVQVRTRSVDMGRVCVCVLLCCQILNSQMVEEKHVRFGTRPGVWLCSKPTDLSVSVSEDRECESVWSWSKTVRIEWVRGMYVQSVRSEWTRGKIWRCSKTKKGMTTQYTITCIPRPCLSLFCIIVVYYESLKRELKTKTTQRQNSHPTTVFILDYEIVLVCEPASEAEKGQYKSISNPKYSFCFSIRFYLSF